MIGETEVRGLARDLECQEEESGRVASPKHGFHMRRFSTALRLTFLAVPVLAVGTGCGLFLDLDPSCPAIGFVCAEGEEPGDTNGDGCDDSCVAITFCRAIPVCEEGETQVDGPGDCLQDDAVCYEESVCGATIWCTGADASVTTCLEDAECATDETCDTENFCESSCGGDAERAPGAICLDECLGRCVAVVVCPEVLFDCVAGEEPVDASGDGCLDSCAPVELCQGLPSCLEGDTQVDGPSGCLQDDAVCYESELCGSTIWCTGPATTSCYSDDDCGSGEMCDDINFCDSGCSDGDADCLAVCLGRCVELPVCPPIDFDCAEGEEAVDTSGNGCVDTCAPLDNCLAIPVCDEGHIEVEGPSQCLQDDAVCYERTVCNATIWCTGA